MLATIAGSFELAPSSRGARASASRRTNSAGCPLRDARSARSDGIELRSIHQNHPDIVDVGQRRPGQQQVAGRGEERGGVVVVEIGLGDRGRAISSSQTCRHRSCAPAGSVALPAPPSAPSVSAASAEMPDVSLSRPASASAYSWLGPPRPLPRTVTVSSPPDRIATRLPSRARLQRELRVIGGDVARLAFEVGAEIDDLVAGVLCRS